MRSLDFYKFRPDGELQFEEHDEGDIAQGCQDGGQHDEQFGRAQQGFAVGLRGYMQADGIAVREQFVERDELHAYTDDLTSHFQFQAFGNGVAVGVGATLTLPCDVRLASTQSRFGFVFGKIGIVPDACASWFLPRVVGLPKALEWTLSGAIIDASTALEAGLVSRLCEPDNLQNEARQMAASFVTSRSPVSVALIRQMMYRNAAAAHPLQAHKVESLGIFYTSMADGKEGVKAFLEKRPAQFKGE